MMRDQDEQDLSHKYLFYLVVVFVLRNVVGNCFPFLEFLEAPKRNLRIKIIQQRHGSISKGRTKLTNIYNSTLGNHRLLEYDFVGRRLETLTAHLVGRCKGAWSRHLRPGEYLPYNFGT